MKSSYKFVLKSPSGTDEIPFHGTQYQGNKALERLSYCLVDSKYTSLELWLDCTHVKACVNKVTFRGVRHGL